MNIELTEKEVKVLNYMLDSYRQSIWDDGCWDLWEIVGEEFLKEQRQAMGLELRYSKGGYAKQSGLLKPMVEEGDGVTQPPYIILLAERSSNDGKEKE